MQPLQISQDIVPLGEFKARASAVLRQVRDSRRPVVITVSGKPAAVLVLPEDYDRMRERERFLESVDQGLRDARQGRVIADEELDREIEAEFGSPRRS